jgi:lysyl-tRNA synthetase class II
VSGGREEAAREAAAPRAAPSDTGSPDVAGDRSTCSACGTEIDLLRDGLCPSCWYASEERPKPVRDRFATLRRLEEAGFHPYAYGFDRTHTLKEARAVFERAETEDRAELLLPVRVAGRILSFRDLGGSAFGHLGNREGRLQAYFRRDVLDERENELLELLDLGDWIGVEGPLFRTRTAR